MKTSTKIFTGILLFLLALAVIWRFLPSKTRQAIVGTPKAADLIMAVGGDPRMLVCQSAADAELGSAETRAKLGITEPLAARTDASAVYRVSVLRGVGDSFALTFWTPKSGAPGKIKVAKVNNSSAEATIEEHDLIFIQAEQLVHAFAVVDIWAENRMTLKTKKVTAPASAVIEIIAPNVSKCVTTRYDDEHIKSLMNEFMLRIPAVLTQISLDGFAAPEQRIMGN
ncbi:MAG: hypothetical protein FD163_1877 [Hyphomonadaceae bacterium]|nr:MAG: hypothetical protein FD163_1877 [Hyphomonadaceae bacterium]